MKSRLSRSQVRLAKEFLAELLGTAVLLMFGCGCVAQSVLSNKENGGMLSINIGWGLGVLLGIMVAGPVSGTKNKTKYFRLSIKYVQRAEREPRELL